MVAQANSEHEISLKTHVQCFSQVPPIDSNGRDWYFLSRSSFSALFLESLISVKIVIDWYRESRRLVTLMPSSELFVTDTMSFGKKLRARETFCVLREGFYFLQKGVDQIRRPYYDKLHRNVLHPWRLHYDVSSFWKPRGMLMSWILRVAERPAG